MQIAVSFPGSRQFSSHDTPSEKYGPQVADRPILASEKVRFVGEEIAAVAAVDEETAPGGYSSDSREYAPLPSVFEIDEALQEGSPLVHEDKKGNVAASQDSER
jgi:CO/xanthine dehydrogenase Mo-binding subunit